MSDTKSLITSTKPVNESEEILETSLRPSNFNEIIGRDLEKKSLNLMIESARMRKKSLDHILFHGPPGLGKTSFAYVIAKEMGTQIYSTNGSVLDKVGDLAAILTSLEPNSILFIDEIHRLKTQIEEVLYPAMEDKVLDIIIGKGPNAKTLRIDLPEFTVIGATTKLSMLSAPLRDRFGMSFRLDFYSNEELTNLVIQKAGKLGVKINSDAAEEIARRARMTARIAIRILKRVRDMAIVKGMDRVEKDIVRETLELLEVDEDGLDNLDRNLIKIILFDFGNKPVGLSTLSVSLSEETDTIESVYEPFLIKKGFLKRTPRGRVVTDKGMKLFNFVSTDE
ncbi:MAG: Holliday junction branch migration DNA helicase RuvB [Candidatus Dojkabacteria bacterium]